MSVLIKGMEMPKNCHECPLLYVTSLCDGFKDCPIVPIPPHGRLIDADALMVEYEKAEKSCDEHGREFSYSFRSGGELCTEWWPMHLMLQDASTIVPADKKEKR